MSNDERKKLKVDTIKQTLYSHNPLKTSHPESTYGAHTSDAPIGEKARANHWRKTMLGQTLDPYKPQKNSVQALKDLMSGNIPVSFGVDHDDYMDFMGWGVKQPNFNNVKNYITSPDSAKALRILTAIAKETGSNSPNRILNNINDLTEDNPMYADIKHRMEKEGSFLNDGDIDELKQWLNSFEVQLRQKKGKEAEAKNQRSKTSIQATEDTTFTTRTIDSALKFGGMLPAMQKEKELSERLNIITEMIQYMDSPEQVQSLRR